MNTRKNTRTFSIGELSAEFGVSVRTLHFYEDKGIVTPIRDGRRRIYSHRDRVRLKLALDGKRFGLSLSEISGLLVLYSRRENNRRQLLAARTIGQEKLVELHYERKDLDNAIADLTRKLDAIDKLLSKAPVPKEK